MNSDEQDVHCNFYPYNLYKFVHNAPLQFVDNLGGKPISPTDPQRDDNDEQDVDCNFAPWNGSNVELGNTPWCPSCGRATLSNVAAKLPKVVQECILQHEKQHEKTCPTISAALRCCPLTPAQLKEQLCLRAKDEVAAYAISLSCAEGKLKQGTLTDEDRKQLRCYKKHALNSQGVYQRKISDSHCPQ